MTQWVLHVDMDQFLAAVEQLRRPELRGKPVVVGGDGDPTKRGVVSTASYEAREFGVHSGLPLRTAAKRCPDCVFLPVDADAYNEVSAGSWPCCGRPAARSRSSGWDEAFIGVDATDDPEGFARGLAADVKAATGLDCSVGIGDNKLQAKIATELRQARGRRPADHRDLVRRARRPPARRDLGHRREDRGQARRARHHHGPAARRRRPGRPGQGVRPHHRPLAGPARQRPRRVGGRLDPVRRRARTAARSPSSATSPTGTRGRGGGRPPGPAGRRRGHRPPGGQGGGQGPLRARSTRSPTAPRCPPASDCPRARPARPAGNCPSMHRRPAPSGPGDDGERWAATFERAAGPPSPCSPRAARSACSASARSSPTSPTIARAALPWIVAVRPGRYSARLIRISAAGVRGERLALPGRREPAPP